MPSDYHYSEVEMKERPYAEYKHFRSTGALSSESLRNRAEILIGKYLEVNPKLVPKDERRAFDNGQKLAIFQRDKGKCRKCGRAVQLRSAQFHHKKPWSKGGKTAVSNGQLMHKKCHVRCHCAE